MATKETGHTDIVLRNLIWRLVVEDGLNADEIWTDLFAGLPKSSAYHVMDLPRLREVCRLFTNEARSEMADSYCSGSSAMNGRKGRPFVFGDDERLFLRNLVAENHSATLRTLQQQMAETYYSDMCDVPSISTIALELSSKRMNLPRKQVRDFNSFCPQRFSSSPFFFPQLRHEVTRYHHLVDPEELLEHHICMSHINPMKLVDLDGMNENRKDFHARHGRAPRGHEAISYQLELDGHIYGVLALYSPIGFLCWTIFDGNVAGAHVILFLKDVYAVIDTDTHLLADNASNLSSELVMTSLNTNMPGRVHRSPPYCPRAKPIEQGFSLVKRRIRLCEHDDSGKSAVQRIQDAFFYYSYQGEGGWEAADHWQVYFDFFYAEK